MERNFNPFESSISEAGNESRDLIGNRQQDRIQNLNDDQSYSIFICAKILKNEDSSIEIFINRYFMIEAIYSILMLVVTFLSLFDKMDRHSFIPGLLFYGIQLYFCYDAYSSFNGIGDHYIKKFQKVDYAAIITFGFNIMKAFFFFSGMMFMIMLAFGSSMAEDAMEREENRWGEDPMIYERRSIQYTAIVFCLINLVFCVGQLMMFNKLRDLRLIYLLRMDRIRNN